MTGEIKQSSGKICPSSRCLVFNSWVYNRLLHKFQKEKVGLLFVPPHDIPISSVFVHMHLCSTSSKQCTSNYSAFWVVFIHLIRDDRRKYLREKSIENVFEFEKFALTNYFWVSTKVGQLSLRDYFFLAASIWKEICAVTNRVTCNRTNMSL